MLIWKLRKRTDQLQISSKDKQTSGFTTLVSEDKKCLRIFTKDKYFKVDETEEIKKKSPFSFNIDFKIPCGNGNFIVAEKKDNLGSGKLTKIEKQDREIEIKFVDLENTNTDYTLNTSKSVNSYSLCINKNFKSPFVFANGEIVENSKFYDEIKKDNSKFYDEIKKDNLQWNGKLLIGLYNGDCFQINFGKDENGDFYKKNTQLFEKGEPLKKSTLSPKSNTSSQNLIESNYLKTDAEQSELFESKGNGGSSKVLECRKLLNEGIDVVVLRTINEGTVEFFVYVRESEEFEKDWKKTELKLPTSSFIFENFENVKCSSMSKESESNKKRFFIATELGLYVYSFNGEIIKCENVCDLRNFDPSLVKFSKNSQLFLFPVDYDLKILNSSLSKHVHTIPLDSKIQNVILSELLLVLGVYTEFDYYEICLKDLTVLKKIKIVSPDQETTFPLNMSLLKGQMQTFSNYEVGEVSLIYSRGDNIFLPSFPFSSLKNSFDSLCYRSAIKEFAHYYFEKLEQMDGKDSVFGPLNPLLFAIFHEDMFLLEELLQLYGYPKQVCDYDSPLSFALKHEYKLATRIIFLHLTSQQKQILYSRKDFQNLLKTKYTFCHNLMANIPCEPDVANFPRMVKMNKKEKVKVCHTKEVPELLERIHGIPVKRNAPLSKAYRTKDTSQMIYNKQPFSGEEVEAFRIPFEYSFDIGSPDSVNFLVFCLESTSEEFLLSDWKEIIYMKWNTTWKRQLIFPLLFWTASVFITFSVVFYQHIVWLKVISCLFIGLLLIYEVLQMICYCVLKPRIYFTDWGNYIDWGIYILLLIYFGQYHDESKPGAANKIFSSLGLILLYYRCFWYLRIFKRFTYLVGMIHTIIKKLIFFFVIVFYFLAVALLLLIKLDSKDKVFSKVSNVYDFSLFGGLGSGDFEEFDFTFIAVVFGNIIVGVILMNLLIAYLSNEFSRLEEQHRRTNLNEIVSMVMDLEVLVYFFRYVLACKKLESRRTNFEKGKHELEENWIQNNKLFNLTSIKEEEKEGESSNCKPEKMIESWKYTYILKRVNSEGSFDNDSIDDNIYRKVQLLVQQNKTLEQRMNDQKEFQEVLKKENEKFFAKLYKEVKLNRQEISHLIKAFRSEKTKNDIKGTPND
jgi:hypothetical protein